VALTTPVINITETLLDAVPANSIFGDRLNNEINWAALDPPGSLPNPLEAAVNVLNVDFHNRIATYDDYGPGTHSWPYWNRDLQQSIAPLMNIFAPNAPPPLKPTLSAPVSTPQRSR